MNLYIRKKSGYVSDIEAKEIGKLSVLLGAGREKKEDIIDNSVGIVLNKKVGNRVEKNEILAYVHANDEGKLKEICERIKTIIKISDSEINVNDTILGVIGN